MGNTQYMVYSRQLLTDAYEFNPRSTTDSLQEGIGHFKHEVYSFALKHNCDSKCLYLYQDRWRLIKCSWKEESVLGLEMRNDRLCQKWFNVEERLPPDKWPLRETYFNQIVLDCQRVHGNKVEYTFKKDAAIKPTNKEK